MADPKPIVYMWHCPVCGKTSATKSHKKFDVPCPGIPEQVEYQLMPTPGKKEV